MMGTRQPPPVAPRTTSLSIQPWQSANAPDDSNYGNQQYARSTSTDSLDSSGSSSSGGGSANNRMADIGSVEYIPTRTVGKLPKLPPHNPLQFVKVQSPLYKKAEQQIQLTKEVKITRETLKEGEEEWQSNLDNWKSRRRKVSEKVIQRAEEMRQVEAEEQLRQDKLMQQQKKIKKFSEIVDKKSTRRFNLDLYIGQGDDSGLGGTPEPEDTLDSQSGLLRSDTSEGMTSEAESIDSDFQKSEKISVKEPPKVPQKPYARLKKTASVSYDECDANERYNHRLSRQNLLISDNNSSTEPSDIEGHAADTEATSSEEDSAFSVQIGNADSGLESSGDNQAGIADSASDLSQDSNPNSEKHNEEQHDLVSGETSENIHLEKTASDQIADAKVGSKQSLKICIKPGDNKGFGFTLKGGKDQRCLPYVEDVFKGGPADEMGLQNGDQIVSLNGEFSADNSHASLVFSIKQAVYTGVLDITIWRAEDCDVNSVKDLKDSRKGKSFAEKLALFSAGNNTGTLDEPKSNENISEKKRESLVLRRRSAFENGKAEDVLNTNVSNQRSSYISTTTKTSEKKLEKRHSVDSILSQNGIHESGSSRKGPPPPIPVKPKIKSKPSIFEANNSTSFKINGSYEDILPSTNSIKNELENVQTESQNIQNFSSTFDDVPNPEPQFNPQDISTKIDKTNTDVPERLSSSCDIYSAYINDTYHEKETTLNCDLQLDHSFNPGEFETNLINHLTTVETIKTINHTYNQPIEHSLELTNEIVDSLCGRNKTCDNNAFNEMTENAIDLDQVIEMHTKIIDDDTNNAFNKTCSFSPEKQDVKECAIICENDFTSNCNVDQNVEKFISETDLLSINSPCESGNDIEDNLNENNAIGFENIKIKDGLEKTENDVSQTNPSPLCLSFEKIDEEDVISASTTTSSDTPDTETVIETLPSNLSPLPNDESNGEDSSKILKTDDEESGELNDKISCSVTITDSQVTEQPSSKQLDAKENILGNSYFAFENEKMGIIEESFYDDQQDDEYARELDESLDQITSLDIIDRIEQSLMDQLQKDDAYENISMHLNSQLKTDINSPWLYYSEESDLLDDLTPRNLEPPCEPPPPPPLPETENNAKNATNFTRTNSTKRIKKEIWRRRSDFLGLDSPEAIDVDNIPPPPPGLEELLKQEREQTQWLEKQLSLPRLPDSEAEISCITESLSLDSENYSTNDYSDYYMDENTEISKDDSIEQQINSWKENLDEETIYENLELQYDAVSEHLSDIREESCQKTIESPQHKAKQNIQSLGAAPKAKIMDSTKWITERVDPTCKKPMEPVFRQTSYNQNYWLAQNGERLRNFQQVDTHSDRRYSMPPAYSNIHPDVTVRTWGDREYEYQQHRPRSAIYERAGGDVYDKYTTLEKKELHRTQSLDSQREANCEVGTLESEVHKCSCCGTGLCEGSAMGIEALRLYFHIECFRCCLCDIQLGNGSCGTDVQVKDNQLYCPACFTVD